MSAAIELFNVRGYDGTSIEDIAKSLGVTKSAIYHHITSKEQLLASALDEALDELEATIAAATAGEGSAGDRLRDVLRSSVEVLVRHQPAVTLLLRVRGNSDTERSAVRRRREIDASLSRIVRAAVEEGSIRADLDSDLVSRLLFGMVNSLVEWYRATGEMSVDRVADAVSAIAFEGLARA